MMHENVFLGGCPVIRPEGIYINGERVIRLGLSDAGDLFAYRQEWEPFIAAHLALWREMNSRFEETNLELKWGCPDGIFDSAKIPATLTEAQKAFCADLALTRMMTSTTDPRGIMPRWNAWANKSNAQILSGASDMLSWLQSVVLQVSGPDKDRLVHLAQHWKLDIQLPDMPSFSTQQEIIARIEGAYTSVKGVLGIIGYGFGETSKLVGTTAQAVADGLTDTAKQLPKVISPWTIIGVAAAVAIVGGALIVYYVPRRDQPPRRELPVTG